MKNYLLLIVTISLTGCVNPINLHTAMQYAQGGYANIQKDKWFNARMAFSRAWTNADVGKADEGTVAVYAYEYGRTSGAICDWAEAERGLLTAYELDKKNNGPVHMSMVELARMYHAQGNIEKSEEWFVLAKSELDRIQADTRDAIGYADILSEYAEVIAKLGKREDYESIRKRESEIRSVFPGRNSGHEQTPYGRFCDQKSLTNKT